MRKGSNDHVIINVLYVAMHMVHAHFLNSHSVSMKIISDLNALNQKNFRGGNPTLGRGRFSRGMITGGKYYTTIPVFSLYRCKGNFNS